MCGRYSLVASKEKIEDLLGPAIQVSELVTNSYNIAPTQRALVLTNAAPQKLELFQWGLIPHWTKDTSKGGRLINARSEGIGSKPSFRVPIRKQRCLVIADSFYEWRREGQFKKPFRILRKDDKLLVFAGIWDVWKSPDKMIQSFSIITTPPNQEMQAIHDRMPLILDKPETQGKWLTDISMEEIETIMQVPKDGILKYYNVSSSVNSVRNNGKHLHDEVDDTPMSLF